MTQAEISSENQASFRMLLEPMEEQAEQDFDQPLAEGKWSMRQQAEHICMTSGGILKSLGYSREKLRERFGIPARDERDYETILSVYEQALSKEKIEVPEQFAPVGDQSVSKSDLLKKLEQIADAYVEVLKDKNDLSEYLIPHPLIGLHTLSEMAIFNAIHNRHHHRYITGYLRSAKI